MRESWLSLGSPAQASNLLRTALGELQQADMILQKVKHLAGAYLTLPHGMVARHPLLNVLLWYQRSDGHTDRRLLHWQ